MMTATGQTLAGHPLFAQLVAALVHRAPQEPEVLVRVLARLCRFSLAGVHLLAARRLLEALRACHFTPCTRRDLSDLLWSTTLLHFASQQDKEADAGLAASFAHYFRHWSAAAAHCTEEGAAGAEGDLWHLRWACDYWQPQRPEHRAPALAADARLKPVSSWQQQVFDRLKAALVGHGIQMEMTVQHFPVDILVDGRVCIEVDGPWHFVQVPAGLFGGQAGDVVRKRRTRDLLVDQMLRHYGYPVLRVTSHQDLAQLPERVRQLMRAPGTPPSEREEPQRPQDASTAEGRPPEAA